MKFSMSKWVFLTIILFAILILVVENPVFAAINDAYVAEEAITSEGLDEAVGGSSIIEAIARLIYAVGRFLEWILGTIFKMLTGNSQFPWADKIVFNAVPLLDINFIHPNAEAFVGQPVIIDILKDLYATLLALAASFFGIVVLITAIKLVITTIASDKAKYKKAIVDWLVGFVMLFCIHYAISFIFYLNEELVKVASNIVTAQLDAKAPTAQAQYDMAQQELIRRVGNTTYNGTYNGRQNVKIKDILEENPKIVQVWLTLDAADSSKGIHQLLMTDVRPIIGDTSLLPEDEFQKLAMIITWASEVNCSVDRLRQIKSSEVFAIIHGDPTNGTAYQAITEENLIYIFGRHAEEITNSYLNTELFNAYGSPIKEGQYCIIMDSTTSTLTTREAAKGKNMVISAGYKFISTTWRWLN